MTNGARLNGSVGSDKRCALIVERSIVVREDGSFTGSLMSVYMSGSTASESVERR